LLSLVALLLTVSGKCAANVQIKSKYDETKLIDFLNSERDSMVIGNKFFKIIRLMNIQNKLFSVFIAFGTALILLQVGLMQWSIDRGMIEYVNQKEIEALTPAVTQLTQNYQQNNGWHELHGAERKFDRVIRQSLRDSEVFQPPAGRHPSPSNGSKRNSLSDEARYDTRHRPLKRSFNKKNKKGERRPSPRHGANYALLDADKRLIVGQYSEHRNYGFTPLLVDKQVVGFLAILKRNKLTEGYEFDFVKQQKDYLWYIALLVMVLVLAVTLPFTRHILSPIKALAQGMHQLTQGKYQSKLSSTRKDEFGGLARDFNELAHTLLENESARKRWLANISHELRTPIAILKGELEAMMDGVRPLSVEQINSAHQEVNHLQRLVADLHALTSADLGGMSYRKELVNVIDFFNRASNKYQSYLSDAGLTFEFIPPNTYTKANVFADETRLSQLFENLINNCIKYVNTGSKVRLIITVNDIEKLINIVVEDDGGGVEERHLSLLFEPLYRVDDSRNRQTGGSGLGLSICAHIIKAHNGDIWAEQSELGGLAIHVSLPLQT